jgi:hypothetical protein
MIVFEEPDMDLPLNLKPCVGCKQLKVLHSGDYCNDCAAKWEPTHGCSYFRVDPQSVGDIMDATGIDASYLKAKADVAFAKHCSYVVYYVKGEWRDITVDEGFHLPSLMLRLFEREGSE